MILSFFVHTGYLTHRERKVSIPNQEIKYEWINSSFGVTDSGTINSSFQNNILNVLQSKLIDCKSLQSQMSRILLSCSCFDAKNESSYRTYYFGIFIGVCGARVSSNREDGHGRYDIAIAFEDIKRLIIFKFKHSKATDDLESNAEDALKQIHETKYYVNEQYCHWKCIAIKVSFFHKELSQLKCKEFDISF